MLTSFPPTEEREKARRFYVSISCLENADLPHYVDIEIDVLKTQESSEEKEKEVKKTNPREPVKEKEEQKEFNPLICLLFRVYVHLTQLPPSEAE